VRLRPPAIAALRRLTAPRAVAGHVLPAGVTVMLPIPLLHRDPNAYDAAHAFRPERWLTPAPPAAFWPFGGGARRCAGEFLAREHLATIPPVVLSRLRLPSAWPRSERAVLRGTILVPRHGALVVADDGA
jgi:cytochrome P450